MALGLYAVWLKGWRLAASLLKYDLLLARRSFADAFATARDRLLLALVTAFVLLWLHDAAVRAAPVLPRKAWMLAFLAGPAAYGWSRAVLRRLRWHRESSVLAPEALAPEARLSYLAWAQLPVLAVLAAGVAVLRNWTGGGDLPPLVTVLSYAAGLALAVARDGARDAPRELRRSVPGERHQDRHAAFRALLAHQAFDASRPVRAAAFLISCAVVATTAGSLFASSEPLSVRFVAALAPSVLLLAATARNAPEIVGLLAFAGYRARYVALSVCALPAANFVGASVTLFGVMPAGWASMLIGLAVLHLLAALIATSRAWLSPGRAAKRVDLQVQLELVALLVVAALLTPLASLAAAWRLWLLHRHYSHLLWKQP